MNRLKDLEVISNIAYLIAAYLVWPYSHILSLSMVAVFVFSTGYHWTHQSVWRSLDRASVVLVIPAAMYAAGLVGPVVALLLAAGGVWLGFTRFELELPIALGIGILVGHGWPRALSALVVFAAAAFFSAMSERHKREGEGYGPNYDRYHLMWHMLSALAVVAWAVNVLPS